jgi:acetylornithine deacetylase/succinyl-diaminopimelate desuccinylase-like protein
MPWVVEHRPELVRADWYLMGGGGGRFGRMEGGHHWIKLITKGQQGHPPSTNFVNAVHKMLTVLPEVLKVEGWMTWKAEGLFKDERPYVDVGKVVGGYQVNIVPDRAEADLDIRTLPNQTREQVERELNALLARLKAEDPQLDVEVQWIWKGRVAYEAWSKVNEDDPLVQAITEIAPKYTGKPVTWSNRIGRGGGRPDLWRVGAKVIYFGVGSNTGANAHGIDEWVSIDGLVEKARFQTEVTAHILR